MRVLVIGGSGHVGSLTLPYLQKKHSLRVLDRTPPKTDSEVEFVQGDLTDFHVVARAAEGCEALLFMAMGKFIPIGTPYHEHAEVLASAFDVSVKGLYLSINAVNYVGVRHVVFTSSMSIYHEIKLMDRYFTDEEIAPDAMNLYGFTKRLGEEVCRNAVRELGISVNVLRLCWPVSPEKWQERVAVENPTLATAADDLANAMEKALQVRAGFQPFMISGDYQNKILNMSKAKRMLDWEPLARPKTEGENA